MSSQRKKNKPTNVSDNDEDDKLTETFVFYGTELPEIGVSPDEDKDRFQPVWKQEVRDENGIRRFHGAFKGGWSAGYFNTVGSKEGWTPSSFVSSRTTRAPQKQATPQDFMDEEDLEELGQNQKLVATEEFDSLGSTERDLIKRHALAESMDKSGSVLGALAHKLIDDFIVPNKDPVGVRLLKKMGWRQGQGIGNRVQDTDTPMISFEHKINTFGLGFNPYKNAPEFAAKDNDRYPILNKSTSSLPKGGLGISVLEDEDEDDIYGGPSIVDFHTTLLDEDEDVIVMGGNTTKHRSWLKDNNSNKKHSDQSYNLCHDGSLPLPDFMLAQRPVSLDKWFAPPEIPIGFKPIHTFESSGPAKNESIPKDIRQKETTLAILTDKRGAMLGEESKTSSRSVFDFVSRKDRERLGSLIGVTVDSKKESIPPSQPSLPKIDKEVALAALRGFMPFDENPRKQARYKQFLENRAGLSEIELKIPEGFTVDDFTKELDDFAKAAKIFQPMSSMIASRFTSASSMSIKELQQPEGGLRPVPSRSSSGVNQNKNSEVSLVANDASSNAEAAARMNMFGPLTRTRVDFYPDRLLCKRFNVANPHPEHASQTAAGKTQKGQRQALSKETMDEILKDRDVLLFASPSSSRKLQDQTETAKVSTPEPVNQDAVHEDIDYTRPSMDIFKAIFDDSESENETDEKQETGESDKYSGPSKHSFTPSKHSFTPSKHSFTPSKRHKREDNSNYSSSQRPRAMDYWE